MKVAESSAWTRSVAVLVFLAAAALFVMYLFSGTGVRVPGFTKAQEYTVAAKPEDVDNLVTASQIQSAGVQIGEVESVEVKSGRVANVVMSIYPEYSPLHEGATVRIGARSLVEETYLDVNDGSGQELEPGAALPGRAVDRSTQLRDLLHSFNPETRNAMSSMLESAGAGTKGSHQDIAGLLAGLGKLGREGHTALDAIAAQSEDLRRVVREAETIMTALDTSEGQIATMVENADRLTSATSGQRQAIEQSMRKMPGVLDSATTATGKLGEMSNKLAPVARNLHGAAPFVSDALRQLPATSRDLRALLPSLSGTLDRAPATLRRVPRFGQDTRTLIPEAYSMLRDVNPMLSYMEPYGPELAAWVANFNAIMGYTDEAGRVSLRLSPLFTDMSVQSPVEPGYVAAYKNALPRPGSSPQPGPFTGEYPRLERDPG